MSWRRRRDRYRSYNIWPEYVPVAERRAKAEREMAKLRKSGREIHPVEIQGRTIARSFWGKGWCEHLESFGDYSNRLPRGRSYVRNGSVCHLGIEPGKVDAIVSGSELYRIDVVISPLQTAKWRALKTHCTGRIGSLIELLQGKLSDEIMRTVTDRQKGLFPLPDEIRYTCDCPDSAGMCKHISAVMYGIGARLDAQPELLFLLRGVDHQDLISAGDSADAVAGTGSKRARRRTLSGRQLENVFGVELDEPTEEPLPSPPPPPTPRTTRKTAAAKTRKRKPLSSPPPKRRVPFTPTSRSVARLRKRLGMSNAEFARAVGVSPATVKNWESAGGPLNPNARGLAGLRRLHQEAP